METIADRLQRLRKAKGLTQPQLAAMANVSQGTIGNIEGGTRKYGASIVNIAKVLDVSPDYLRSGKGRKWSAETGSAGSAEIARPPVAETLTIAETLERLGDLLMRANPKTRAAVADLLARYAQDPSSGRSIAKAIEMLVEADQA